MNGNKCKCIACKRKLIEAREPVLHGCSLCGRSNFFYWSSSRIFLPVAVNHIIEEYKIINKSLPKEQKIRNDKISGYIKDVGVPICMICFKRLKKYIK